MHHLGGDGPALLLLHGFGSDRLGWAATTPALLASYSVYAAELPGHGTAKPAQDNADALTMAALTQSLVEQLPATDDPLSIIGHSLGGTLACHLAEAMNADVTRKLGGIVLLAPAGFGSAAPDPAFLEAFPNLQTEDDALALLRRLVVRERLIVPAMAQHVLGHLNQPGRRETLTALAKEMAKGLSPTLPEGALVVWGESDQINPAPKDWLGMLGEQALLLPETGHLPHVEASTKVNRAIGQHLAAALAA